MRTTSHELRRSTSVGPLAVSVALMLCTLAPASEPPEIDTQRGDRMIADYFRSETQRIAEEDDLTRIESLEEWENQRETYRKQLLEMLGLDPMPERTDLKPVVTGTLEHDEFTVERVHFQSRPGLYVTGNLYIPKGLEEPAPTILYVCGHAGRSEDGVSFGNKTAYRHHPAWFARHGYVSLAIDTLQLGEIEGLHHGTYREGMWWWNSRGYTPAGVEAWNCVRALDYLETREEVDADRFGVTGRSGGGAYSWWIAAIDDRIKAAVPVAGITDLHNHVVDGAVEGHCDCMFTVNTHRWDYAKVAALVAPRPLLISNSDKDPIFPLDGVVRVHEQVRHIYDLHDAGQNLGLHITEGPHQDTQELRVGAFSWFNQHLKDERPLIAEPAVKFFEPAQLRVFDELPDDQINTRISETFVPKADESGAAGSAEQGTERHEAWMDALRDKVFAGWPDDAPPLNVEEAFDVEREGLRFRAFDFTSQEHIRLRLYLLQGADRDEPERITLRALNQEGWRDWLGWTRTAFADELSEEMAVEPNEQRFEEQRERLTGEPGAWAFIAPRGIGPTAWDQSERKQVQHRRRFMLLGQTLDGMRVWDVRRAVQALRSIEPLDGAELQLKGEDQMAGIVLYASLFEPDIAGLSLSSLPQTHRDGPTFLNVLRFLDMPQALAMARERTEIETEEAEPQSTGSE